MGDIKNKLYEKLENLAFIGGWAGTTERAPPFQKVLEWIAEDPGADDPRSEDAENIFGSNNGFRENVANYVVIVTDQAPKDSTILSMKDLRKKLKNVQVIVVLVKELEKGLLEKWEKIAGKNNVVNKTKPEKVGEKINDLLKNNCGASPVMQL